MTVMGKVIGLMEQDIGASRRAVFLAGVHDGVPIALGYFVVAFTLGILAKTAGLTPWQGFLTSFVNLASAGEYAGFTVIAAQAPYLEIAVLTLVANARYFLMSAALTQRFAPDTSLLHRLAVSFGVSDEIFGITVARGGMVNPYYNYGAMAISVPAWAIGTSAGILAGGILPADSTPSHVTSPTHPFLTEHGSILHRHIRVSFSRLSEKIYPSEGRFDQVSLISSIVPVLSPLDNHLSWCPDIYKWRDLSYNKRIK